MTPSDERFGRWRERRARRLEELGLQRTQPGPGGSAPAYFVADEVLVRDDHRQLARDVLAQQGHRARDTAEDTTVVEGFRRYRARDLDVLTAARSIGERAGQEGDPRPAASPNHVFLSAPFEHGGPFGPPTPITPATELAIRRRAGRIGVAVVDTGVWRDSPLPPGYYEASEEDFESDVDVDDDGVIDGDVGHANFIAGVVAQRTTKAAIRIIRVLDTFGTCTEFELIVALGRLGDETTLVNLSLGGFTVDDQPPLALRDALHRLLGDGDRLAVAAAGNDGERTRPFWPAAFAGTDEPWSGRLVSVAAHDGTDVCSWSNAGDWITLAAPGADVCSTYVRHTEFSSGWAQWSGTSFATPHAVAALAQAMTAGGSSLAALEKVLAGAAKQTYGGYPALT